MYDFGLPFAFVASPNPMLLTREQIENIAHLARLALQPAELPVYQQSLSAIFDFVGELDGADTANVAPMAHPLAGQSQRLRPDVVTETDRHEIYQRNAPQVAAGLYLVPKVIE
ncbi:MAG: aspartyl-tRNA(Asn)/glutamyl-tRNA(Gln) amidotransferase subunit [Gammaproteobacteria bacterium]|jgi:aspartyl-tRNA(Asn)/glutamyl-tRNA(Gln) amidotransferase subunit C|nr:aspartyl-tRNA(Asn)/glutamyl-tRNA(Gln) amidotransferase subunit [Gammaproteobacteria bacterium]